MTSRRLVLLAADLLVTAISLAFWLSRWVKANSYTAGTPPFVKGVLRTAADSIPTARAPDVGGAFYERVATVRAGHGSVPLDRQGASARRWTRLSRSTSSGSEQITLSVGSVEEPRTVLYGHGTQIWTGRLARVSLNPESSLAGGVA